MRFPRNDMYFMMYDIWAGVRLIESSAHALGLVRCERCEARCVSIAVVTWSRWLVIEPNESSRGIF